MLSTLDATGDGADGGGVGWMAGTALAGAEGTVAAVDGVDAGTIVVVAAPFVEVGAGSSICHVLIHDKSFPISPVA